MDFSLDGINFFLNKPFATTKFVTEIIENAVVLLEELEKYAGNLPATKGVDDLKPLLRCLREEIPVELEILFARLLKIFLTKSVNRTSLGNPGLSAIVYVLRRQLRSHNGATSDICNAVLNSCYDKTNAQLFVDEGGMQILIRFLGTKDFKIIISTLGALQVLCTIPSGRQLLRQDAEVGSLLHFQVLYAQGSCYRLYTFIVLR